MRHFVHGTSSRAYARHCVKMLVADLSQPRQGAEESRAPSGDSRCDNTFS